MGTRPRQYGEDTPLNRWIRNHPDLDSSLGFVATDVDLAWYNHILAFIMILEHKEHMGVVPPSQEATLSVIDQSIARSLLDPDFILASCRLHIPEHVHYCGLHTIVCQNTSPDDGEIFIDGVKVTEEQFLRFLRFEWTPVIKVYRKQRDRLIASRTLDELQLAVNFAKGTIYSRHPETEILRELYHKKKEEITRLNQLFQYEEPMLS